MLHVHLGLIHEVELALGKGEIQVPLQVFALPDGLVDARDIELELVAPLGLGKCHGLLCFLEQPIGLKGVVRIDGDANGGGDIEFRAVDVHGAADLMQEPVGHGGGLVGFADVPLDDRELVSPEPATIDEVVLVGVHDPFGDDLEKTVAAGEAVLFIERFEIVQANAEDRGHAALAARGFKRAIKQVQEHVPVRQAGERIVA